MELGRIWAEIDLDALEHNLELVRNALTGQKILLAIKADAYGHGGAEIGCTLQDKVDIFGVAGVEEGINLRKAGVAETPILVLSPIPYHEIPALFDYRLSPTVTEARFAELLGQAAATRNQPVKVHIEVDTGMGRTGVSVSETAALVTAVRTWPNLAIEGIFTHFPSADSDFSYTARQIQDFSKLADELSRHGLEGFLKHAANTSGFLNFPAAHFDIVRPGLIVYGILPEAYAERMGRDSGFGIRDSGPGSRAPVPGPRFPVRPVMSLRSRIVNLRSIPEGHRVSYEGRFVTRRDSRIAVITAGYGDGYPYALTNRGEALVCGQRSPIAGNVCMDLTMLDVTEIPNAAIGDVVTLLGCDNGGVITANELAKWAATIPYEITCRVSPRVPRVFKRGGEIVRVRNLLAGNDYGRRTNPRDQRKTARTRDK